MDKIELGKIEKIADLRQIWPEEDRNFTPWLAEEKNLALLGEEIGIDIYLEEKESNVGQFSVDIFAKEEDTTRKIIIENQLEDTDHDHLGKLITYAAGKNAEIIIWVVKHARDEHRQAIEWLNNHTDDSTAFFLVEVEVWTIDDSKPAPKFNVVERPNDWANAIRHQENLSSTESLRLEFWTALREYASRNPQFTKEFSLRTPSKELWYSFSIGIRGVQLSLTISTQKNKMFARIIIKNNSELSEKIKEAIPQLEKAIGTKAQWNSEDKSERINFGRSVRLKDREAWPEAFDWMISKLMNLKKEVLKIARQ